MSSSSPVQRIFVAGATGFIGNAVVYALLEAGAFVTALIPAGRRLQAGARHERLRLVEGDAWNRGSLTGHGRGHRAVIHLVGSLREDPGQGHSYHYMNVDSLQNITRMAVGDGVPLLVYLSAAGAPWLPGRYTASKREAEDYLIRSGIPYTLLRAPLAYPRGKLQNPAMIMTSIAGAVPILGRPFSRWAPLPVDVLARAIAEIALNQEWVNQTLYGRQLRQISRAYQARLAPPAADHDLRSTHGDDSTPFGWLP